MQRAAEYASRTAASGSPDALQRCSKIGHIYQEHLKRWFERAFNQEEQLAMERAFIWPGGLGDADDTLFSELTKLVKQLENEAKDTLALVNEKRPDQAQQSVLRTYMTLPPVRKQWLERCSRCLN
jgi:hypothetical protein